MNGQNSRKSNRSKVQRNSGFYTQADASQFHQTPFEARSNRSQANLGPISYQEIPDSDYDEDVFDDAVVYEPFDDGYNQEEPPLINGPETRKPVRKPVSRRPNAPTPRREIDYFVTEPEYEEPIDYYSQTPYQESYQPIEYIVEEERGAPTMAFLLGTVGVIIALLLTVVFTFISGLNLGAKNNAAANAITGAVMESEAVPLGTGAIAPFFSPSVQYWESEIIVWSERHNLDANMIATVMQVESCGDPQALSGAGAMGLFQVMPYHFQAGEDGFNPEINALRGMNYLAERLIQTGGEVGHAFAGYNGGQAAAASGWNNWAAETQRYYTWTTGIYADASNGRRSSDTLTQWYAAGGTSLCQQAEARLGIN